MKDIREDILEDILNDVDEMSDLQVLKELNIALVPSSANGLVMVIPREYKDNMGLLRAKLIDQRLSKLDEECSGNKMITDAWKKECNSDSDEVFEGEAEALNKLYRDVGLPVEDSESTDDQSLDEILEKDVEDTSMEEILKIADYLDKQGGES